MYPEVGDIGGAGQHQSAAVFIAEARGVFLHQKQVQPVAAFGRLTHQILMPAGEGIGIHHDAADDVARPALARQLGGVALQAARAIFHQHHDARHGGDRVETALAEQRLVLHLGVDKQLSVVALVGRFTSSVASASANPSPRISGLMATHLIILSAMPPQATNLSCWVTVINISTVVSIFRSLLRKKALISEIAL